MKRNRDDSRAVSWPTLLLIPIVYVVMLVYLALMKGTAGNYRFGPDPLTADMAPQDT